MAIDTPLKRKRGRPAGGSLSAQSPQSKMEQKMALVKQRLALLDSASSSSSDSDSDMDDALAPKDNELAIVVAHQPVEIHHGDTDDEDVIPLKVVKSRRVESEQRKLPGVPRTYDAQKIVTGTTNTAKASDVNGQKTASSLHSSNCGSAIARAKEVQAKLPAEHPSFIKNMLQSHVVRGFWLGLPCHFCNKHLPKQDTEIVLEDENGQEHRTLYLGTKQGLSAGWRGYAIKHAIKVGDVVVFELVRPRKFKLYIMREKEFTTTDGAVSLLNLEANKKGKLLSEEGRCGGEPMKPEEEGDGKAALMNENDDGSCVGSDEGTMIDGLRMSDSDMEDFEGVRSFSDFSIVVDRLVIDCKFQEQLRRTYYELCRSQRSFLHRRLLKQLNLTLVTGVIMETVSIAEGIRAACRCRGPAGSREDLVVWKKSLESFEVLGMDVGFLLGRVKDLLVRHGETASGGDEQRRRRYRELKQERARAEEKVRALEQGLSRVKDSLREMEADMAEVESSVKRSALTLQQLAAAPAPAPW